MFNIILVNYANLISKFLISILINSRPNCKFSSILNSLTSKVLLGIFWYFEIYWFLIEWSKILLSFETAYFRFTTKSKRYNLCVSKLKRTEFYSQEITAMCSCSQITEGYLYSSKFKMTYKYSKFNEILSWFYLSKLYVIFRSAFRFWECICTYMFII